MKSKFFPASVLALLTLAFGSLLSAQDQTYASIRASGKLNCVAPFLCSNVGSVINLSLDPTGTTTVAADVISGANGETWTQGSISELLTLSTGGATTDTTANLLPANSIIEAVVARVTTTITTATDWKLGDATTAGRFSAANSTLTAGTTQVGLVHVDVTGAGGPRQTAAAKLRVTTTGTPGAGALRITVFFRTFVPPTS